MFSNLSIYAFSGLVYGVFTANIKALMQILRKVNHVYIYALTDT